MCLGGLRLAELQEVVGAILRAVARGRVSSDEYSRDVSIQYERDPLLRLFPVPRVDVGQITVNLRFAVASLERKPSDWREESSPQLKEGASVLGKAAYQAAVVEHPKGESVQSVIAKQRPRLLDALCLRLEEFLLAPGFDARKLAEATPKVSADILAPLCVEFLTLNDEVKRSLLADFSQKELTARVSQALEAALRQELIPRLRSSLERSQLGTAVVDVLVTRADLEGVQESQLSSVTIVAQVRNLQWAQVDEIDGAAVRRLMES